MSASQEEFFNGQSLQTVLIELAVIAAKNGSAEHIDKLLAYLETSGTHEVTLAMIKSIKGISLKRFDEVLTLLKPLIDQGELKLLPFAVLAADMGNLATEVDALLAKGKVSGDPDILAFSENFIDEKQRH